MRVVKSPSSDTPVVKLKPKPNHFQIRNNRKFYKAFTKIFNARLLPPPNDIDKNYIPSLKRPQGYHVISQTPYAWISVYYMATYLNMQPETVIRRMQAQKKRLKYDSTRQAARFHKLDSYIFMNDHWHYLTPDLQERFKYWNPSK